MVPNEKGLEPNGRDKARHFILFATKEPYQALLYQQELEDVRMSKDGAVVNPDDMSGEMHELEAVQGYSVAAVHSGHSAVQAIKRDKPDLLVMGGRGGLAEYRALEDFIADADPDDIPPILINTSRLEGGPCYEGSPVEPHIVGTTIKSSDYSKLVGAVNKFFTEQNKSHK